MEEQQNILAALKRACGPSVLLPRGFLFSEDDSVLTMTFRSKHSIGLGSSPRNMQQDAAAFEGWAVVLYVHYLGGQGSICLDVQEDLPQPDDSLYTTYHHYSRFLYRALRFSRQYPWFQLSQSLERQVEAFQHYLGRHTFKNNLPGKEAGVKGKLESAVESRFASEEEDAPLLRSMLGHTAGGGIFRQLPVGLFQDFVAKENRVFTGGTSAIDLWTVEGDTLTVLELKADNKMVGAVTELFFYANYAYDMFVSTDGPFQKSDGGRERGYDTLLRGGLRRVRGCLLLDEESCHPLIDDAVIAALNQTSHPGITYDRLIYHLELEASITSR